MRYILSAKNVAILRSFTSGKVLPAFYFDGTLAPISSDPKRTAIRSSTAKLLRKLTPLYPCVVASGRSRADILQKLKRIRFREFIGNHGIEPRNASRVMRRNVEPWIPILKSRLGHFDGIVVENKQFSVSVHYRHERNKKRARQKIIEVAGTLPGARWFGGKQVMNIVLIGSHDKGFAVEQARRRIKCDRVVYVGDDQTDEDVFAGALRRRCLTVRVGLKKSSFARFYVRNQRQVDRLVKTLIEFRADHQTETIGPNHKYG
jgi:trehalose 6-phosphate phosphatase